MPEGVHAVARDVPAIDEPTRGVIRNSYSLHVEISQDQVATKGDTSLQQLAVGVLTRRGKRGSLPITWTWTNPIEAAPGRLHFGTLNRLTSGPGWIVIRSTEDRAFRILSITGDAAASLLPASPEMIGPGSPARKVHRVSLRLQLKNPNTRAAAGTATIMTDDISCPNVSFYWSAFVERSQGTGVKVDR